jgi:hypothetical protein
MQFSDKVDVLPGIPFMAFNENKKKIEEEFKKEISEIKRQEKADWVLSFQIIPNLFPIPNSLINFPHNKNR